MTDIATYVFFDTETTGLPFQERNQTKIIEFCFLAVQRKDLESTPTGEMPLVKKLSFVLNPEKSICRKVTQMTGLSLRSLKKAPTFREKFECIVAFLKEQPSPVCLVAHNGNCFDFKILQAECKDACAYLPNDLFCVDSLVGFRNLLLGTNINYTNLAPKQTVGELITDDEDELTEDEETNINASQISKDEETEINAILKDLEYAENVSEHVDNVSEHIIVGLEGEIENVASEVEVITYPQMNIENTDPIPLKKKKTAKGVGHSAAIKKVFNKNNGSTDEKENFKLATIYKRLTNKEDIKAHRAEGDCLMLLQCVIALKKQFLPWADKNCKLLSSIPALRRY